MQSVHDIYQKEMSKATEGTCQMPLGGGCPNHGEGALNGVCLDSAPHCEQSVRSKSNLVGNMDKIITDCQQGSSYFFIDDDVKRLEGSEGSEGSRVQGVQGVKSSEELKSGIISVPALVDLHVHFREPGNPEKETIKTGVESAEAGGYGLVCTMPNLTPVPDCLENLKAELALIEEAQNDSMKVIPFGSLTKGRRGKEPARFAEMMPYVAGFSDDGNGVEDDDVMEECMSRIAALGGLVVAHPEKGEGLESESREVERDIRLAAKTGCRLHLCHISTRKSIELIREAKREGVKVSCETAPHYLLLEDDEQQTLRNSLDGRFRMNPPIGTRADRIALVDALIDGTIDVIATDHAPHTEEDKRNGANGVVGLESAFPVMYTHFVRTGLITLDRLVALMSTNGMKILGMSDCVMPNVVWDVAREYEINPSQFKSKGRSCPFEGMKVFGKVVRREAL